MTRDSDLEVLLVNSGSWLIPQAQEHGLVGLSHHPHHPHRHRTDNTHILEEMLQEHREVLLSVLLPV